MVSLRLVVPLACLIATSLALPRNPVEAIQCIIRARATDGISETCICLVARTFGRSAAYEFYRHFPSVSNNVLRVIDSCQPMEKRSSTSHVTDDGGNAELELINRGLSDHLNPTFPDEDEGEE